MLVWIIAGIVLLAALIAGFFIIRSLARVAPSIANADGRRYWAFLVILGGCIVFTTFAAVGVYLVRGNAYYSLILALAAHVQLLIGMGTFGFVLGRRMRFKGGRDGLEFNDTGEPETPAEGAAAATKAAAEVTEELREEERG